MHAQSVEIFDVECDRSGGGIESNQESIGESIRPSSESIQWIKAAEAIHQTRLLNKSAFQKAVTKLIGDHQIPISCLRRGEARNTEYSLLAVRLIKALKSGDVKTLEKLKSDIARPPVTALAVGSEYTSALTQKANEFKQKTSVEAESIEARILETLSRISQQQKTMQQTNATLSDAEKVAARNQGIALGLEIISIRQQARDEVIARAQAMGLGG